MLLLSCKNGFEELNKDPNTMNKALPQALFAPAITGAVKTNMVRCRSINNELMQVTVDRGDTDYKVFRYDIRGTLANYIWNAQFINLANLKDLYLSAEERFDLSGEDYQKTYMAISLITQAWLFSIITDMYGDIPYSEALKIKEGIIYPKFDSQEEVYHDIFLKLEEANNLLAANVNIPADLAEPVYNGNALKWRKFCNSLYLRLLLRVSNKMEIEVKNKFAEMLQTNSAQYPVFTSNDDSAILRVGADLPYQSPFANQTDAQWTDPKLTEFFVENLKTWKDPRLDIWASKYNGQYVGIPSGYAVGTNPVAKSRFLVALRSEPLLGNIMNYAELQFILAEAAVKGWISSSAKTFYENGVAAGITLWKLSLPSGYLNYDAVKWEEANVFEDKMERIHTQKYYSLFYTDHQQWYEYRRTGYPVLPKGPGLQNGGIMPERLNYPVYLYATNRESVELANMRQGADDINTKVWWNTKN